jgi:hypothetical protein
MSTSFEHPRRFGEPGRLCASTATRAAATPQDAAHATGRCADCGFELPLTPTDAVAVIVSLPARYRSLLDQADSSDTLDPLLHSRPRLGEWSVLEYVGHVSEVLHVCANRLVCLFDQTRAEVTPPPPEAPAVASNTVPVRVVCAQLVAAAARLAHAVNDAPMAAWTLTNRRGDVEVTAFELLRETLGDAHHHLHDIAHALASNVRTAS